MINDVRDPVIDVLKKGNNLLPMIDKSSASVNIPLNKKINLTMNYNGNTTLTNKNNNNKNKYNVNIPKKMNSHVDIPVEKNDLNEKDVNVLLESVNPSVSKKLHSYVDIPIKNKNDPKEKDINIPLESKKMNSHVDIPVVEKKILKKKMSTYL